MSDKTELLPCPFCGGKAEHKVWSDHNFSRITCEDCGLERDYLANPDEAFTWWNTRAAPTEDVREVVDEPVAEYQVRTRSSDREGDEGWSLWERCSEFNYTDYVRTPLLHGWEYQTRKLYCHPQRKVVMPERHEDRCDSSEAEAYQNGWNACLDEFERLNK